VSLMGREEADHHQSTANPIVPPTGGIPGSQLAKRLPVEHRYDLLDPTFLHWMARLAAYGAKKYGECNWTKSRLVGMNGAPNHIAEHLRQYVQNEPYDHFDGDVRWHLVAVAFNAMIEFFNCSKWGHVQHPLSVQELEPGKHPASPPDPVDSLRSAVMRP
jgi:hypothetical protein